MKRNMLKSFLLLLLGLFSPIRQYVNAQTGGIFDLFQSHIRAESVFKKKKDFVPGSPIPPNGIKIDSNRYQYLLLLPFPDNDSVYTIVYREHEDGKSYVRKYNERFYYHMLLVDRETADTILYNTLNKSSEPNKLKRQDWLDRTLVTLGIKNRGNKPTSNWIFYKPRKVVVGNTGTPGSGRIEFESFSYKVVQRCMQEQYSPTLKLSGMEILGAMMLYNMFRRSKTSSTNDNKYWEDAHWWSLYRQ